jgi:hypothetical protein
MAREHVLAGLTDKPVKKARGGVASRKAKANSIAINAARTKMKEKDAPSSSAIEEESLQETTTPVKAGDISFVLNAPSSSPPGRSPRVAKSPNTSFKQTPQTKPERPSNADTPPSFVPNEPAHNCMSHTGGLGD